MPKSLQSLKDFVHKHKRWEPLVFFIGGFGFDALLLHRIDDPLMLAHQAIYLSLAAFIIAWDLAKEGQSLELPKWIQKIWNIREGILHFLLGTLLNVYTIFYFKSGTLLSSILFIILLIAFLILNEVRPKQISKHILRNSLFGLCLISYMNIIVSIMVGSIGFWVFLLAIAVAIGVLGLFEYSLRAKLDPKKVSSQIRIPFATIAVLYTALYLLKVLPPVPLSVKHIGIYREISKEGDQYRLGTTKSFWRFWESGDQNFEARPGDKIHCFVQVFSPTRFKDQLFVRWEYYEPSKGWKNSDAIPLSVVGGRAEGYRGHTSKSNYQPGDWRISIETSDGREIGRIGLTVSAATDPAPPTMNYEYR